MRHEEELVRVTSVMKSGGRGGGEAQGFHQQFQYLVRKVIVSVSPSNPVTETLDEDQKKHENQKSSTEDPR